MYLFYFWTAFTSRNLPESGYSLFNDLARGFLRGNLYLDVDPNPKLLDLVNPYDPVDNLPYRLHDASLFNGRYFSYFGPLPAILLYLPAQLIGYELHAWQVCFIIAVLQLFVSYLVLKRMFGLQLSLYPLLTSFVILLLGFGSVAPILLRRPAIYEISILAGSFFLLLSILSFSKCLRRTKWGGMWALLAVSFAILAFSSRPSHLIAIFIMFCFTFIFGCRGKTKDTIFIVTTVFALLALIALYNQLRFGSFFEFGVKYQLSGFNNSLMPSFDLTWIWPKLSGDFLTLPNFNYQFPFLWMGSPRTATALGRDALEPTIGLLILYPWIFRISAAFISFRKQIKHEDINTYNVIIILVLFSVGSFLVQMVAMPGITMRYTADYSAFLVLASSLLLLHIHHSFPNYRRFLYRNALPFGFVTIGLTFLISLTGYFNPLNFITK
jgi:hypothetical protein